MKIISSDQSTCTYIFIGRKAIMHCVDRWRKKKKFCIVYMLGQICMSHKVFVEKREYEQLFQPMYEKILKEKRKDKKNIMNKEA